ncbi:DUF3122 domain-containing protein [Cyanobium sp. Morenito 9A2]|uniref:DUF3122 domain-containing protein n=1 Tax=Cyanobium sp. Morenito 9A2 TaxID=2823718 RepID=UPI0020CCFEA5|nr:DUF3122 domain-containing protein [Cyanobium sp. Morenito 9A2]MCP9849703.1 DUF3122 domain-containing protein [Cyanobium sp. Morenito 9A2]
MGSWRIKHVMAVILSLALGTAGLLGLTAVPAPAWAHPIERSLESLRDLDDQSWQLVAYHQGAEDGPMRLRLVGFPGKLRLEHPTALQVRSGPFRWSLADLTMENPQLAVDGRSAVAEFDLEPLLAVLQQNRPLRLRLPGAIDELVVPPYVVQQWRALAISGR